MISKWVLYTLVVEHATFVGERNMWTVSLGKRFVSLDSLP